MIAHAKMDFLMIILIVNSVIINAKTAKIFLIIVFHARMKITREILMIPANVLKDILILVPKIANNVITSVALAKINHTIA